MKLVPCWIFGFLWFKSKIFWEIILLMGSGWGLAYARPEIVYILSKEDRLILRKEIPGQNLFSFIYSQSWLRVYFPARLFNFDSGSLHSISQLFNFLDSWHILNFWCLILISFISQLFRVFNLMLFPGCHFLTLRSVTYLKLISSW